MTIVACAKKKSLHLSRQGSIAEPLPQKSQPREVDKLCTQITPAPARGFNKGMPLGVRAILTRAEVSSTAKLKRSATPRQPGKALHSRQGATRITRISVCCYLSLSTMVTSLPFVTGPSVPFLAIGCSYRLSFRS